MRGGRTNPTTARSRTHSATFWANFVHLNKTTVLPSILSGWLKQASGAEDALMERRCAATPLPTCPNQAMSGPFFHSLEPHRCAQRGVPRRKLHFGHSLVLFIDRWVNTELMSVFVKTEKLSGGYRKVRRKVGYSVISNPHGMRGGGDLGLVKEGLSQVTWPLLGQVLPQVLEKQMGLWPVWPACSPARGRNRWAHQPEVFRYPPCALWVTRACAFTGHPQRARLWRSEKSLGRLPWDRASVYLLSSGHLHPSGPAHPVSDLFALSYNTSRFMYSLCPQVLLPSSPYIS